MLLFHKHCWLSPFSGLGKPSRRLIFLAWEDFHFLESLRSHNTHRDVKKNVFFQTCTSMLLFFPIKQRILLYGNLFVSVLTSDAICLILLFRLQSWLAEIYLPNLIPAHLKFLLLFRQPLKMAPTAKFRVPCDTGSWPMRWERSTVHIMSTLALSLPNIRTSSKVLNLSVHPTFPIWKMAQYENSNRLTAFGEAMNIEHLAQQVAPTLLYSSIPWERWQEKAGSHEQEAQDGWDIGPCHSAQTGLHAGTYFLWPVVAVANQGSWRETHDPEVITIPHRG